MHTELKHISIGIIVFIFSGLIGCSNALEPEKSSEHQPKQSESNQRAIQPTAGGKADHQTRNKGEAFFKIDFRERLDTVQDKDNPPSSGLRLNGPLASPVDRVVEIRNAAFDSLTCEKQSKCTFQRVRLAKTTPWYEKYTFIFVSEGGADLLRWMEQNKDVNGVEPAEAPGYAGMPTGMRLNNTIHCGWVDSDNRTVARCGILESSDANGDVEIYSTGTDFSPYIDVPEGRLKLGGDHHRDLRKLVSTPHKESHYVGEASISHVSHVNYSLASGTDARLTFRGTDTFENGAFELYDFMYVAQTGNAPISFGPGTVGVAKRFRQTLDGKRRTETFGDFRCQSPNIVEGEHMPDYEPTRCSVQLTN